MSRSRTPSFRSPAPRLAFGLAAASALAALLVGAGLEPLPAQAPPRPDADITEGPWTVDDVLGEESAGQFRVSPDGNRVVWVRSKMDREAGHRVSNLWMTRLPEGETWQLTRGDAPSHSPRWSPDGELVVYLSSETPEGADEAGGAGGDQVWALRSRGGEPWAVTTDLRDVRGVAFRGGSSDSLVVLAREAKSRYEQALEEADDDTDAVEDTLTELPYRLWSVEIGSGEVKRLTDNDDWIEEFAVSPDGGTAVVRAGRDLSHGFDGKNPPRTFLVDLETGDRSRILRPDSITPRDLHWAPDGSGIYFTYAVSSHPVYEIASVRRVGFWDVEKGRFRPVETGWDRGVARPGIEAVPGGFLALLADGVRYRPVLFERTDEGAWGRKDLRGEHVPQIFDWAASPDGGTLAYVTSAADRPHQPYAARLKGRRLTEPVRLARLNPGYRGKPVPRAEVVDWAGARGDTVEGMLYYPLGYREGRRYPLVVSPHGGPPSADLDAWSQSWADPTVLYNQRGAFVFKPNYHGSSNYGLEWVESIGNGNYYELEIPDIQKGVDRLVERGLVHPDSIAAQGWSNGAILSIQLTVEDSERYRAAAVGAGDVEWISDWGTVAFAARFDNYYFGGSLFDIPQVYMEKSPLFDLPEVETPTLIFHGTEDRAVYPAQGWSHFRALQQRTDTPVRFLLFPGEPHGLEGYAHQRRKVAEELQWMDAHLWGEEPAATLALKSGSPLDRALEKASAARSDGRLGVLEDGTLVPETVPWRKASPDGGDTVVEIGRFEVTRAQWAEFTGEADYPAGTGDHPVSGVTAEQARAYTAWLSRLTGDTWRLPDAGALRKLARQAPRGNTLDHWAGYSPNPADAERLREAASRLPGETALLEEAGSFPAHRVRGPDAGGTTGVWNLGGNVAEWASGPDGLVAVGRNADRADDPRAGPTDPTAGYRGLRVVRIR